MAMRSASRDPDRARAVGDPAAGEKLRGQREAGAFRPDQVLCRDLDVVEVQDVGGERGQHLDRALGKASRVGVDDERADGVLVALLARSRVDDAPVRVRDVACPHLLAVDDVPVALPLGAAADGPRRVRAARALTDRGKRLARASRDHRRRVAVEELARRTEQHARRVPRERAERREVRAHPALGGLLCDDRLAEHGQARATELPRRVQRPQTEPPCLVLERQQ